MTPHLRLMIGLSEAKRVLLTGPIAPDGDSIGACLALQRILQARGMRVDVAGTPSYRYDWLPGAEQMIPDQNLSPVYDAVVVLDGDRKRLTPPVEACFNAAALRGIIDHHASTKPDGYTHFWLDGVAASTCEMLFRALGDWDVQLDQDLAAQLYTGAIFDTGGFRYSNTVASTHHMAADLVSMDIEHAAICTRVLLERRASGLRLSGHVFSNAAFHLDGRLLVGRATQDLRDRFDNIDGDLEGIVDALVHVMGVDVACLLVEREGGEVKYSLRSRGKIDVSHVARDLAPTGGGHPKAAGASVYVSVDEAAELAIEIIGQHLDRADARSA